MNASTSADGRLGLGPHTGQSDAPVGTKAHAQRGRRQLPASQERCWQVNWTYPAKKPNDRATSRTVVWTGACCPTSAQETRGRVFDGTSQATRPKHEHARGQQPGSGSWRSSTAPRQRTSRERLYVNGARPGAVHANHVYAASKPQRSWRSGKVKRQYPSMSRQADSSPAPTVGGAAPRLE